MGDYYLNGEFKTQLQLNTLSHIEKNPIWYPSRYVYVTGFMHQTRQTNKHYNSSVVLENKISMMERKEWRREKFQVKTAKQHDGNTATGAASLWSSICCPCHPLVVPLLLMLQSGISHSISPGMEGKEEAGGEGGFGNKSRYKVSGGKGASMRGSQKLVQNSLH